MIDEKLKEELADKPKWVSVTERLPKIWVKVLSFQPTFDEDCRVMV